MATYWLNGNDLISTVKRQIAPAGSVLDIGCGIRPQFFIRPNVHVCCEPYKEYIDILRRTINEDRHYIILKASWADAVRMFPEFSVDTVFLIDVIEHLGKEEGKTLLEQTIKLARKQVVIFTPLGFFPQSHTDGKDRWGLNGGAWQEHKSGWMPQDLDDSWDIYAAKEFHRKDQDGNTLERPFGAFFAILNNDEVIQSSEKQDFLSRRIKVHRMVDKILDPIEIVFQAIHGLI